MKKLHAIAGLPRSGSTLLCDLLNQNPRFHASSTSALAGAIQGLRSYWSTAPEVMSDLAHDKDATQARVDRALIAVAQSWYEDSDAEVVFDKGRGWSALHEVMPIFGGKIVCCVRDPRAVFASIEKHRAENPTLVSQGQGGLTQMERAHQHLGREGMVGGPMAHIEDLIQRGSPHVVAVVFERLVNMPEPTMRELYVSLGEEYFEHDFEAVEGTATDMDAQYLYKFPHKRETGPVKDPKTDWKEHVAPGIAEEIVKSFPTYCSTFGYK